MIKIVNLTATEFKVFDDLYCWAVGPGCGWSVPEEEWTLFLLEYGQHITKVVYDDENQNN